MNGVVKKKKRKKERKRQEKTVDGCGEEMKRSKANTSKAIHRNAVFHSREIQSRESRAFHSNPRPSKAK